VENVDHPVDREELRHSLSIYYAKLGELLAKRTKSRLEARLGQEINHDSPSRHHSA
jgi:hypothetical protein